MIHTFTSREILKIGRFETVLKGLSRGKFVAVPEDSICETSYSDDQSVEDVIGHTNDNNYSSKSRGSSTYNGCTRPKAVIN